jgi:hypothetical protein
VVDNSFKIKPPNLVSNENDWKKTRISNFTVFIFPERMQKRTADNINSPQRS